MPEREKNSPRQEFRQRSAMTLTLHLDLIQDLGHFTSFTHRQFVGEIHGICREYIHACMFLFSVYTDIKQAANLTLEIHFTTQVFG